MDRLPKAVVWGVVVLVALGLLLWRGERSWLALVWGLFALVGWLSVGFELCCKPKLRTVRRVRVLPDPAWVLIPRPKTLSWAAAGVVYGSLFLIGFGPACFLLGFLGVTKPWTIWAVCGLHGLFSLGSFHTGRQEM